jgi:hypothetical protein
VPQTTYNRSMGPALAGQIADNNPHNIDTLLNKSGGSLAAGVAVAYGATTPAGGSAPIGAPPGYLGANDGQAATNLALNTDEIAGITALTFATDPYNIAGTATYREGTNMDVLTEGQIYVACEQAIASITDSVNVRFAALAGNTVIGAFTNTPDAGTRPVKGAKWKSLSTAASGNLLVGTQNIALLYFSSAVDFATH